jgi:hypothetical protein
MSSSHFGRSRGALWALTIFVVTSLCLGNSKAQDIAAMNNQTLNLFSKGSFSDALAASAAAVDAARQKGVIDLALA